MSDSSENSAVLGGSHPQLLPICRHLATLLRSTKTSLFFYQWPVFFIRVVVKSPTLIRVCMHLSVVCQLLPHECCCCLIWCMHNESNYVFLYYWLIYHALHVSVSVTSWQYIFSLKLKLLLCYSLNLSALWCEIATWVLWL